MLNPWWMVVIYIYWKMFFLVSTSVAALTEFCAKFECFSQDLTEMLLISRWIGLLLPALCIMVSRDREQPTAPVRADTRSALRSADLFRFPFVRCSSCKSIMMRTQSCSFHFRNWETTFSLTEYALRWRHRTRLSPKSAAIPKMCELLRNLRSLLDLAINSAIAESQNPGGTD